jgi:hypothetical protein
MNATATTRSDRVAAVGRPSRWLFGNVDRVPAAGNEWQLHTEGSDQDPRSNAGRDNHIATSDRL